MKTFDLTTFLRTAAAAILLCPAASCDMALPADAGRGRLEIRFAAMPEPAVRSASPLTDPAVRSDPSIPDTNGFLLKVTASDGTVLYSGTYGASPQTIVADAGCYTVEAMSCAFSEPLFDSPQYGDTQVVEVKPGQKTDVLLVCSQINAGIRLVIDDSFKAGFPGGTLYLKSAEGRLMYSYSERRTAFFKPGTVALALNSTGEERTLFTRALSAQEMLTMRIRSSSASQEASGSVSVMLDTCRNWVSDTFVAGEGAGGGASGMDDAYGISQARSRSGEDDVWVYGYIVGGDLSSSRCSFSPPFASRTNIVLAARSSCIDKDQCLSVQLAKGEIRDALNLVDHPENLGRQVFLRGDLVGKYYGIPGIQNLSEFAWK